MNLGLVYELSTSQGSGAGGNTSISINPPDGNIYVVKFIETHQDDAARTYTVTLTDGTNTITFTTGSSYAANLNKSVLSDMGFYSELVLTPGCTITITWNSLAAAKTAYLNAHIEVFKGYYGYKTEV